MKRIITLTVLLTALWLNAQAQVPADSLREADLLFAVNPRGNAITSVTHGTEGLSIDHVALVHRMAATGEPWVIEAVEPHVTMVPLDSFRREQTATGAADAVVLVGRIGVPGFSAYQSVTRAMRQLGKPYDHYYEATDSAIYCSELVTLCYTDSTGRNLLGTVPMEFRDSSGHIPAYWTELYARRGQAVPEGAPGSNPGELSRRREVTIVGRLEW